MTLPQGIRRKTFTEIKSEIEQSLIKSLGSIDLVAPSVLNSIVDTFADREASLWDLSEAVYNSLHPETADGYSLDGVCAINGVNRLNASFSRAVCQLTAVPYTTIAKNSMILVKNTSNLFVLDEDLTVTNENCYSVRVQVKNCTNSSYELIINQEVLHFDKTIDDTTESIAKALAALVNEKNLNLTTVVDGDALKITVASNDVELFNCFVSEGIELLECTNCALFIAKEKGAIAAPINSLTDIHTPISGWISCNNLIAAKIGVNQESDHHLRARRVQSIMIGGSGNLEAIRANILNLKTVMAVSLTENCTTQIDENGIPPHSFEALVTGGEDLEVANAIWRKKPAGILSHGNILVIIEDSTGHKQAVRFSRPTKCFVYGKITIIKTKDFAPEAVNTIKAKLVDQINSLGSGGNVILKSLYTSIFSSQGIANASIKLGVTEQEETVPAFEEKDIAIKANEVAITDISKIEISLEDF